MHHARMNELRSAAIAAMVALSLSCVDRSGRGGGLPDLAAAQPSAPPSPTDVHGVDDPVVILTIDGVRWQEVFEGTDPEFTSKPLQSATAIWPNLYRLGTKRGAFVGAPGHGRIAASGPQYVSLPGYTEILSGRPSLLCQDNDCPRTVLPSILDEAHARGAKVAAFASWDRLDYAITSRPGSFFVSAGRGSPPTVESLPGSPDERPDRLTAPAALAYYQAERPDVFFLGLGDPDEHAHHGDYDAYVDACRYADEVIGELMAVLDRDERGRRTHVVVTPDHGRASSFFNHGGMPEAARTWLVATGPRIMARGDVASVRERHLADIAPTMRLVLGLPADHDALAGQPIEELFASAN